MPRPRRQAPPKASGRADLGPDIAINNTALIQENTTPCLGKATEHQRTVRELNFNRVMLSLKDADILVFALRNVPLVARLCLFVFNVCMT